jgi:hypothetical protein
VIKHILDIRGRKVYFASETCVVSASRFWTESKYIGKIFGTRIDHHHQIWIKEPGGQESFADFQDRAGPIKEGDVVQAVWASRAEGGGQAPVVYIYQHMTRASCWAYPGKSEIMSAMQLPFKMGPGAEEVVQAVYKIRNEEFERYHRA